MIQKTTQRQLNAALGNPIRPTAAATDGPEEWGQWIRNKHYSLEVTQHPLRARMCGFGDKDRRPLAPAAVAKMIVRREDNSIIDVDDVDVDFFLVTVDLWSADGKQEMNLVLHPSSADRYVPTHLVKPRKPRGLGGSVPPSATSSRSSRPSPYPAPNERPRPPTNHPPTGQNNNPSFTLRPIEPTPSGTTPIFTPTSTPSYNNNSGYPFPPQSDPFSSTSGPSETSSSWSYPPPLDRAPFSAPTLPSIHSLGRGSPSPGSLPTELNPATFTPHSDTPDLSTPFRGWNDVAAGLFDTPNTVDPTLRDSSNGSRWSTEPFALPSLPTTEAWTPPTPAAASQPQTQHSFQPFGQTPAQPQQQQQQSQQQSARGEGQHTIPPLPRHTYTRTLVGPLSANAQRLQDEHRKPGIFFLFQDLSIRTEGTFRLRMRLMNVGAPPAPNGLANSVHTGVSPVLAQIFTEPFSVYSAKRFPGVPDTTALSIAFGNQGQKLPLRNRHGNSKQQRRPHRSGSASSDEDSS